MADAAQTQKAGSGSRALLWLLILLLLGTVWWLASERNARKYTLSAHDGVLVVSRGHFFPTGTGVIGEGDPEGKLYAGLTLPAGSKSFAEIEYDDENALDRGLYDLLSSTAHALAKKGGKESYAEADELAKRLSNLRGLTADELGDLTALRAELAFWSAAGDVQTAATLLTTARRKLEEVRANGGEHAVQAAPLQEALSQLATQLAEVGARFTPGAAMVGTQNIGTPTVGASTIGAPAGAAPTVTPDGLGAQADGGTVLVPIPVPAAVASPPGAVPANTVVAPVEPAEHGASAPGSVSSGASRGK